MIDDPAIAKEALDIILSASVDRRGYQMDMYQLQDADYCFVFGEETTPSALFPIAISTTTASTTS